MSDIQLPNLILSITYVIQLSSSLFMLYIFSYTVMGKCAKSYSVSVRDIRIIRLPPNIN